MVKSKELKDPETPAKPYDKSVMAAESLTNPRGHDATIEVVDLTGDSPPRSSNNPREQQLGSVNGIREPCVRNDNCAPRLYVPSHSWIQDRFRQNPIPMQEPCIGNDNCEPNVLTYSGIQMSHARSHHLTQESYAVNSNKRKIEVDRHHDGQQSTAKRARTAEGEEIEKRLIPWRRAQSMAYQEIRHRAMTQRMIVLDRRRNESRPDYPTETVTITGTTGNVYTVIISKIPDCDCPHSRKGHRCKHVVYVLCRVLRVPEHLEHQAAFLSSELREIFAQSPALPSKQGDEAVCDDVQQPLEGECPICCDDMQPHGREEEVVYCKEGCGNNIHKLCFERWAATKQGGDSVPCPFCRAPWARATLNVKDLVLGTVNDEGYFNVADQLGLPDRRDYSTYYDDDDYHFHPYRHW